MTHNIYVFECVNCLSFISDDIVSLSSTSSITDNFFPVVSYFLSWFYLVFLLIHYVPFSLVANVVRVIDIHSELTLHWLLRVFAVLNMPGCCHHRVNTVLDFNPFF